MWPAVPSAHAPAEGIPVGGRLQPALGVAGISISAEEVCSRWGALWAKVGIQE